MRVWVATPVDVTVEEVEGVEVALRADGYVPMLSEDVADVLGCDVVALMPGWDRRVSAPTLEALALAAGRRMVPVADLLEDLAV